MISGKQNLNCGIPYSAPFGNMFFQGIKKPKNNLWHMQKGRKVSFYPRLHRRI